MVNNNSLKKKYHKIRKIIIYIFAGVNGISFSSAAIITEKQVDFFLQCIK
jgi:hypothetical protein